MISITSGNLKSSMFLQIGIILGLLLVVICFPQPVSAKDKPNHHTLDGFRNYPSVPAPPSLSIGFVIASLILICKKFLSWFPDDWLIFTPWGIILVIISAFVGGALSVRGRILLHSAIILIVFYFLFYCSH